MDKYILERLEELGYSWERGNYATLFELVKIIKQGKKLNCVLFDNNIFVAENGDFLAGGTSLEESLGKYCFNQNSLKQKAIYW